MDGIQSYFGCAVGLRRIDSSTSLTIKNCKITEEMTETTEVA